MHLWMKRTLFLVSLSVFLSACGGGSDDSPEKPVEQVKPDFDKDGLPDATDTDDDNDGVADADDAFPFDASESLDTDGDGIGNNADTDDDNDGVADAEDAFPLDASETLDTDKDGIGNNADTDDDNDGVADTDDAFPLDASESLDTDSDGIGNNADTDDDNDGIPDNLDAFLLDPSESLDTDSDGVGDNADTDDDNDGVEDDSDLFPLDSAEWQDTDGDGIGDNGDAVPTSALCYLASDAYEGRCYQEILGDSEESVQLVSNNTGQIFFYLPNHARLVSFDLKTAHFGHNLTVSQSGEVLQVIAFSPTQNTLYLGYQNGLLTALENSPGASEQTFAQLDYQVTGIEVMNEALLVNTWYQSRIYLSSNEYVEGPSYIGTESAVEWDASSQRLYYLTLDLYPSDLNSVQVDTDSGNLTNWNETPYHGDFSIEAPILVSPNSQQILLGSGDIYAASDLTIERSLGISSENLTWLSDEEILALDEQENRILLRRISATSSELHEELLLEGNLLGINNYNDQVTVVYRHNDELVFYVYSPSDDSDGDGVTNAEDDYPSDPAASVDSDADGYPDAWNEGKTDADSLLALTLDAYPNDSACYLNEHGDGTNCDIASQVPDFTPTAIEYDDNGVVYLLNQSEGRVYRWDSETQSYLNPLVAYQKNGFSVSKPTMMTLSHSLQRLYFGYESGKLTKVDLEGEAKDSWAGTLAMEVLGLAEAGNYVLAQDNSGAWASHYVFSAEGVQTDYRDWNEYSQHYAWNSANNRVYFFRDYTSPNDLHYEQINQQTGLIESSGETPYHGDYDISGPILISPTGDRVLIGAGDVYDANSMEHVGSLNTSFVDAVWTNEAIVTLNRGATTYYLAIYDQSTYELQGEFAVSGSALALVPSGEDVIAVKKTADGFSFFTHLIADHDGDGLPGWWESLYGLNDSDSSDAALDSDDDGLTNTQEYAAGTVPLAEDSDNDGLTDGEEVSLYATDPLLADSDSDELNDGDEVITYGTNPLSTDSDEDGIADNQEVNLYGTNPLSDDSDSDGIPDLWEVTKNLDPNSDDSALDADADGLVNLDEYTYGSEPYIADTDGDDLSDGDEVHTYLTSAVSRDTDGDLMDDGWEITYSFDPLEDTDAEADGDSDGYTNLQEFLLNTLPDDDTSIPQAQEWSTLQGNASHNGFVAVRLNPDNFEKIWSGSSLNLSDSIAIAEGTLFAAIDNYSGSGRRLVALDVFTGVTQWEKSYVDADSINSPAYYNGKVYFQTGGHDNSFIRALDAESGNLLYKSSYSNQWSSYRAPTPTADGVYIAGGYYGGAYRFGLDSGLEDWFADLEQEDYWTPAVDEDYAYFFTSNGLIKANKESGSAISTIETDYEDYGAYTPVLGFSQDAYARRGNALIAFDLATDTVNWVIEGSISQLPAAGMGELYVIKDGTLTVVHPQTGEMLWVWEPSSGASIESNVVVTFDHVFVSDGTNTYAVDLDTHATVWTYPAAGNLSLSNEGALVIHDQYNGTVSVIATGGDTDSDGLPDWWEQRYGLDTEDAGDASADSDSDSLTNLEEYAAGTDPTSSDTDGDGLTDSEELNDYATDPLDTDSDNDQLDDYAELFTYSTDPLATDSDGDAFSDGDEVFLYGTDPADADSVPESLTSYSESFESASLPAVWVNNADNPADWYIDGTYSTDGSQSIRAGVISHDQTSTIGLRGLFSAGTLSFDAKVSAEDCCDYLLVYVDGDFTLQVTNGDWVTEEIPLSSGEHEIEFIYYKDGSVNTDEDTVWVDNVRFEP